mmetsp:Transcript_8079/g.15243  ORF Transcript_8079/g.15243 Transcript_8079/m.15243 type:complete len:629 (+) Transcript_8079:76-1962(+)
MEMNCTSPLDGTSKLLSESNEETKRILTTSSPIQQSKEMEEDEEPERHAINPLLSPTKSTRLTMGSRVIILGTDNVEQRVPQYVGVEAEIVVVPVHPATWFKVKFDNGKIVTFRPSALRLVSDGTTVDASYTPPPKKPKAASRPRSNSLKSEKSALSINSSGDCDSSKLLTSIHTDTWPGCKVRILSGRMTGHIANVLGSGNGWVQLESSYGELAKRANELELISDASSIPYKADTLAPLSSSASVRPILQRRRSNSEPGSPTEISNRRNEFSTRNPYRKERRETELQRQYVQKYVDKEQAKIGTRPDLKYWLSRLQGTTVDPKFERNVSREVRSHFCHSCYMEMWSGSKFCWNELCPMSPVYWKLAGAAGSPPLARYRHAAHSSNMPVPLNLEIPVEDSAYACEVLLSLRSDIRMPDSSSDQQNSKDPSPEKSSVTFAPSPPAVHYENSSGQKRKVDETKPKRSDSTHTDCEDVADDSSDSSLKLKIKLSPKRSPTVQVSPSSPRKENSPRPSSTSPRLNFKRIRMSGSSPVAQGIPPSAEEFAKIVNMHEQQQQKQHALTSAESSVPSHSAGPLPGLVSNQLPNQINQFNSLTTTSPLLTSLLNPDYPTNKAFVMTNVLDEGSRNA